jgi:prepilin-type N-terminal cleavage/methylation domain-containing protein
MVRHQQILSFGPSRTPSGFTLLEAVIATAILAVMMTMVYAFLATQASIYYEEESEIDGLTKARRVLDEVVYMLSEARPLRLPTENDLPTPPAGGKDLNNNGTTTDRGFALRYVVPLRVNNVVQRDGDGYVRYGISEGFETKEYTVLDPDASTDMYQMRFRTLDDNRNISEVTLSQQNGQAVDLNLDGDSTDVFILGELINERRDLAGERSLGGICYILQGDTGIFTIEGEIVNLDEEGDGVYDDPVDETADDVNANGVWDARARVRLLFPTTFFDPRQGRRVSRLKAAETRVFFRNGVAIPPT